MAARKTTNPQEPQPDQDKPVGRFHALAQEAAASRRAPYQLTADIVVPAPTLAQIRATRATSNDDTHMEILLGAHHAAVLELYADRDFDEWLAFQKDLYEHFFGQGARDVPGGSQGS